MTKFIIQIIGIGLTAGIVAAISATAQETEPTTSSIPIRCEVFCSTEKLRTANARLLWPDARIRLIRRAESMEVADVEVKENIETTVFKNGFKDELYASFPTTMPEGDVAPALTAEVEKSDMRAYQLHLIGVQRPSVSGRSINSLLGESLEKQEASAVIEGLEPGLTYYWRVRLETESGVEISQTVSCEAPICPADMQEGDEQ
jgi:hypothetical protein